MGTDAVFAVIRQRAVSARRLADLGSGIVASATLRLLPLGACRKAGQGSAPTHRRHLFSLWPRLLPTPRGLLGAIGPLGQLDRGGEAGTGALNVGHGACAMRRKTGLSSAPPASEMASAAICKALRSLRNQDTAKAPI
jgi:hypothetical protein